MSRASCFLAVLGDLDASKRFSSRIPPELVDGTTQSAVVVVDGRGGRCTSSTLLFFNRMVTETSTSCLFQKPPSFSLFPFAISTSFRLIRLCNTLTFPRDTPSTHPRFRPPLLSSPSTSPSPSSPDQAESDADRPSPPGHLPHSPPPPWCPSRPLCPSPCSRRSQIRLPPHRLHGFRLSRRTPRTRSAWDREQGDSSDRWCTRDSLAGVACVLSPSHRDRFRSFRCRRRR
jgi:hypothetical protein